MSIITNKQLREHVPPGDVLEATFMRNDGVSIKGNGPYELRVSPRMLRCKVDERTVPRYWGYGPDLENLKIETENCWQVEMKMGSGHETYKLTGTLTVNKGDIRAGRCTDFAAIDLDKAMRHEAMLTSRVMQLERENAELRRKLAERDSAYIGSWCKEVGKPFGDARVYGKALTEDEIKQIYEDSKRPLERLDAFSVDNAALAKAMREDRESRFGESAPVTHQFTDKVRALSGGFPVMKMSANDVDRLVTAAKFKLTGTLVPVEHHAALEMLADKAKRTEPTKDDECDAPVYVQNKEKPR